MKNFCCDNIGASTEELGDVDGFIVPSSRVGFAWALDNTCSIDVQLVSCVCGDTDLACCCRNLWELESLAKQHELARNDIIEILESGEPNPLCLTSRRTH